MLALLLGACGGGSDGSLTGGPGGGGGAPGASALTLIANSTQLQSANNTPVEITAIVTDANSGAVEGALVVFNAGGDGAAQLTPSSTVLTDANGLAKVSLGTISPTNRAITVNASLSGGPSASVVVNVVGTGIEITGPNALGVGDTGNYTVFVSDSNSQPLSGRTVTLSSANGNTITAANVVTGAGGTITFQLTADNATNDIVSAQSMGATGNKPITVSNDSFAIISPVPGQEIPLGNVVNFTVTWIQNGAPVVGETVNFASARGTLSAGSAITNGSGQATVTLSSNSSGISALTVFDPVGGAGTSIDVEFVALTADSLILQPQFTNLVPNQTTTLSARVNDANGNAVKNKTVVFSLTADNTNGTLSPLQAITDSNGTARSFYTAGPISGGTGSVTVSAVVSDTPAATDSKNLTVGGQAFSFDIGTGNEINELSQTLYGKEWSIIVTDASSNPVVNSDVQVSGPATEYRKGFWVVNVLEEWEQSVEATCESEDINGNGQLDPGEDTNGDGFLTPGNVVSVVPIPAAAPLSAGCEAAEGPLNSSTTVRTNSLGIARVCVIYNQDKAFWARIALTATAGVSGSESTGTVEHWLSGAASDYANSNIEPPGRFSPYGISDSCNNPL